MSVSDPAPDTEAELPHLGAAWTSNVLQKIQCHFREMLWT